ncbi:MAG: DNA-3-methyladenine glycosylase [Bacteroidota bacterium]
MPDLFAPPPSPPLDAAFFTRPTLDVARDLLGRLLTYTRDDGAHTAGTRIAGRIVETEAYLRDDPALRGWKAAFGPDGVVLPRGRAADLFAPPGTAYVYRVYYTNWLLNVVTEPEGVAGAVLIRALEPVEGQAAMQANRPASVRKSRDLANGPGKLTQALGVDDAAFHGTDLTRPPLCFEAGTPVADAAVATSSRIGLTRGIALPYRFFLDGHPCVSPGVPSDVKQRPRAC